jgi:pimeloyl-ACP methyl ester carboxylesterase
VIAEATGQRVDEVEEFLAAMVRPARRDPPRVAERLRGIRPDRVPTPYGTVAAWRIGAGPAVLLVHGFDDDHTLWEPMLDALVARGRAAVVFDLPAHGLSTGDSGMGWEAARAAEVLIAEYAPVDAAVGHSIGALGLIAALTHSQIALSRAVLISTPLNTVDRWRRNAERFGMPNETADRARALYETRVPDAKQFFDASAGLARIGIPLLLVNSADDVRAPFTDAQRASAGCPNVQLHAVDGLGHRRTARDPSVAAAVAEFLD